MDIVSEDAAMSGSAGPRSGGVACGHPVTLDGSLEVLRAGGNAFDAVAAGVWCACVAEPLLASPGGGGFLLAAPESGAPRVYDFFTHTPGARVPPGSEDFLEVLVDFGPADQSFQIGWGSVAVPGVVAGVFRLQRELGRMPAREVMAPALAAARNGVVVNAMQGYVASILAPILRASPEAERLYAPGGHPLPEGSLHRQPELADLLEILAYEGEDLFYSGEVASAIDELSRSGGGHIRRADLEGYRVEVRSPLEVEYRRHVIWSNPPPASGGLLVAFGLSLLAGLPRAAEASPAGVAGVRSLERFAAVLAAMQEARHSEGLTEELDRAAVSRVLSEETLSRYRARIAEHPRSFRGTTHISVVDRDGNAAALSLSNGEGCGRAVPGTGMMLNNMLGEADLQPSGFGRWPPDTRLTSMMAPTVLRARDGGRLVALGSGGSNRIRSAILQVLTGLLDDGLPLEDAIVRPRLHVEGARLDIEGGIDGEIAGEVGARWGEHRIWDSPNLFFGGVHAVEADAGGVRGAGDPRRGGVTGIVERG